jgi:hypothetical protein
VPNVLPNGEEQRLAYYLGEARAFTRDLVHVLNGDEQITAKLAGGSSVVFDVRRDSQRVIFDSN